jgi:hypothetical protein
MSSFNSFHQTLALRLIYGDSAIFVPGVIIQAWVVTDVPYHVHKEEKE